MAKLQDASEGTVSGGDSARGETPPLLRDTDRGHPAEGWRARRRKREEVGEEEVAVVEEPEPD